ncbi:MAG: tetratricopeptide repeat protein [Pirellulales bacterium]
MLQLTSLTCRPQRLAVVLSVFSSLLMARWTVAAEPAAQQPAPTATARKAQQQVVAIFKAGQEATSADQLAGVLAQCASVDRSALSVAHAEYFNRLQAWIHNKRGEALAAQAEEAVLVDQLEQADSFEAAALREFHSAVELDPNSWQAHHNRGVSLASLGQLPEAIRDFDVTIRVNPQHKNAWFNRAEIFYQLDQFDRAETDYGQVIQLDPKDQGAYLGRAHVRHDMGKHQLALADYNTALELDPQDAEALIDRGNLHAMLGSWQLAANDYRQAIRTDKNSARAYQQAAWMMATCPDAKFRNADLAVKAAQRALQIQGEESDHRSYETLAAALATAGKFEQAVEIQRKAIELAPANQHDSLNVRLTGYQQHQPILDGGPGRAQPSRDAEDDLVATAEEPRSVRDGEVRTASALSEAIADVTREAAQATAPPTIMPVEQTVDRPLEQAIPTPPDPRVPRPLPGVIRPQMLPPRVPVSTPSRR